MIVSVNIDGEFEWSKTMRERKGERGREREERERIIIIIIRRRRIRFVFDPKTDIIIIHVTMVINNPGNVITGGKK